MKAYIALALSAVTLVGCQTTGELTPSAQARVTAAFNAICPAVSSGGLDAVSSKFNQRTQDAFAAAKMICANGAPTNAFVAGMDILVVYPLLEPYTSKIKVKI